MRCTTSILAATLALAAVCPAGTPPASASGPPSFTPAELTARAVERRAIEAAVWGMPLVNVDAMRQAYFAAGATYNDCIFWSNPTRG